MKTPGTYDFIGSVKESLLHSANLVDSRTESDWLNFMARFAPLINFYDQQNRPRGNWEPFVLKDPVILMAFISKTNYSTPHNNFKKLCTRLMAASRPGHTSGTGNLLNSMFDNLTAVFLTIRQWIYYMQLSGEDYRLKDFAIREVKNVFSSYFWAIVSLRQQLYLNGEPAGVKPANQEELCLFDAVDGLIWKESKDKAPCWDVLELAYPLKQNPATSLSAALIRTGKELYRFQFALIEHACAEMELLKNRKAKYPDTLLLRSFADMLSIYRQQFNAITRKHLLFGYREILKLKERPAEPDYVYICAAANRKDQLFTITEAMQLDAGNDEQNNPVAFAAIKPAEINPAEIIKAYTLSVVKGPDNRFRIFKNITDTPGTILKDESGKLKSWPTFGSALSGTAILVKQSVAFASPLLLLREGEREIIFTLSLSGAMQGCMDDVQYYLSTQQAWLPVKAVITNIVTENDLVTSITLRIMLSAADPAVESFQKNVLQQDPDGLNSEWPLLKMEFGSLTHHSNAPQISRLKMNVKVRGVKTLQLYNDHGALDSKNPFQLFGPTPLLHSHFLIGSAEVLSKPADMIQLKLDWDKLPPDFATYYKQYNQYLTHSLEPDPPPKKKTWLSKLVDRAGETLKNIGRWIKSLFGHKKEDVLPPCPPFSNTCFRTRFSSAGTQQWSGMDMFIVKDFGNNSGDLTWTPYQSDKDCGCSSPGNGPYLFATQNTDLTQCQVATSTFYVYDKKVTSTAITAFPFIQHSTPVSTGNSTPGFFSMTLSAPEQGFGSGMYGDLVTAIANKNAWILYKSRPEKDFFGFTKEEKEPVFIEAAKQPFIPKVAGITINYSASHEYDFSGNEKDYPLQYFMYTPFRNYCAYDTNEVNHPLYFSTELTGLDNAVPGNGGLPCYQTIQNQGNLFLELGELIAPASLNLYFELVQKNEITGNVNKPLFRYAGKTGWDNVPVLEDGTGSLSCSGIIRLQLPDAMAAGTTVMPGNNCWLSISVDNYIDNYAQTVFLKTNGFLACRVPAPSAGSSIASTLPAGTITKPRKPLPQIPAFIQPFASFGGKAPETETDMLMRCANRLASKDRAVTAGDFCRLIHDQFQGIYYTKAIYITKEQRIAVYVARACNEKNEAHALMPLAGQCTINAIQLFLQERVSASTPVMVANFTLEYVQVTACIKIKEGYSFRAVQLEVNNALVDYLSPWIKENKRSSVIDQPVGQAETDALIRNINGVEKVSNISFRTWPCTEGDDPSKTTAVSVNKATPSGENCLLVPLTNHTITELK